MQKQINLFSLSPCSIQNFIQVTTVVNTLMNLLCFLSLFLLNCTLYHHIHKRRKVNMNHGIRRTSNNSASRMIQRDVYVATILVLIVVIYAVCNSIRYVHLTFQNEKNKNWIISDVTSISWSLSHQLEVKNYICPV